MNHDYREVFIYADNKDNLFIIPTAESKRFPGVIAALDLIINLSYPYSEKEIEEKLLRGMELCFTSNPNDASGNRTVMEKYFNVKGYSQAVKDKRFISFHWDIDDGYSVIPSQKIPKQGYVDLTEKTIWLGKEIKKGELARALKKAMEISTP